MTQSIQFIIHGTGAVPAAAELMTMSELTVEVAVEETATSKSVELDPLTVTASIVTIVGGSLAIAEQIRQWHLAWQAGKAEKTIDKVVITDGENRLLLKNASKEQLIQMIEAL